MHFLGVPQSMKEEIHKSAYLLKEYTADSSKGPDKSIPAAIFAKAKGVAMISYCGLGCFISARGGSGIVVAKTPSGGWSAPSAVGIVGISGGFDFGIEMTAIIMMLMTSNAVKAFMKGKNVMLGGNISVAVGPLGRDLEVDMTVRAPAAMYTYAKAKGLYLGINLGGTLVLERRKANEKSYGAGVRAEDILSGRVDPPPECYVLHDVLRELTRNSKRKAFQQAVDVGSKAAEKKYGIKGLNKHANKNAEKGLAAEDKYHNKTSSSSSRDQKTNSSSHSISFIGKSKFLSKSKPKSKPSVKTHGSKGPPRAAPSRPTTSNKKGPAPQPKRTPAPPPPVQRSYNAQTVTDSGASPQQQPPRIWGEAIFPFSGEMTCDISFQKSDRIEILTRTPLEFDWWEGRLHGKVGIFPANYVRVVS
ncbi:SH3 domain-containing YSC84-like protein 1 isoform X2 [Bolinopsis microptera]|uniref:SH3 domain-containing YSC84-like protein 1 isoform X2 n=1 Tax=Bolinopsis microptera TaxID=2820187 RepID=UPI0030792875